MSSAAKFHEYCQKNQLGLHKEQYVSVTDSTDWRAVLTFSGVAFGASGASKSEAKEKLYQSIMVELRAIKQNTIVHTSLEQVTPLYRRMWELSTQIRTLQDEHNQVMKEIQDIEDRNGVWKTVFQNGKQ